MKFNSYIIDITHTTLHTLFWAKGMPYYERKTRYFSTERNLNSGNIGVLFY